MKYLFVPVEGIDNELHHPIDLSLESEFLRFLPQLLNLSDIETIQLDCLLLPLQNLSICRDRNTTLSGAKRREIP